MFSRRVEYYTDDDGKVTKVVEWFGFKLHLLVDVKHELSLSYKITNTKEETAKRLRKSMQPMRVDGLSYLPSGVHTDRTCDSATAGSRVGATSILVAYGVAALIGESGLAGEWLAVGMTA